MCTFSENKARKSTPSEFLNNIYDRIVHIRQHLTLNTQSLMLTPADPQH